MKSPYSGEAGVDWHLGKKAYHFYGPPNECCGELTVVNLSDSKVKVRSLSTQKPSRQRKDSSALQPSNIILSARVPAHSEAKMMASLALPPETAPGDYQASVICGKQKVPIEVKILEHREVLIEPTHLRAQGQSGELITTKIAIKNLGNVALDIRDIGMVWLRERDWIGRTLVYALREKDPDGKLSDFGDRLLKNLQDEIIPTAKVQFEPKITDTLLAGCSLERTLKLILPMGLKKGRRYSGFIKINENRIWLEVYCSGNGSSA